ncbi:hypothetical protein R6L23_16400 [Streptomyces sp. SR27]|uniref:hypothetical protein n=1 Tax=Streptomyces sp. SR27 TaxID=3076630 RepID=UPI00295C2E53|nr:hypothetical protein [Streptomyces sp. SR27]MDV9189777.1 hypothetical protein [Streptomyces sp. SR27]
MLNTLALAVRLTAGTDHHGEIFDGETLALLKAVEVPLPDFAIDLDIAFGTPLEMYEPFATPRERAAALTCPDEVLGDFFARRHAARDILASDPSITALVRERLVDVLLPHATRLRITCPAGVALPEAA